MGPLAAPLQLRQQAMCKHKRYCQKQQHHESAGRSTWKETSKMQVMIFATCWLQKKSLMHGSMQHDKKSLVSSPTTYLASANKFSTCEILMSIFVEATVSLNRIIIHCKTRTPFKTIIWFWTSPGYGPPWGLPVQLSPKAECGKRNREQAWCDFTSTWLLYTCVLDSIFWLN